MMLLGKVSSILQGIGNSYHRYYKHYIILVVIQSLPNRVTLDRHTALYLRDKKPLGYVSDFSFVFLTTR